jgi:N-acetylglutamate synthase-like GNAT family acetyltransferase
MNQITDQDFGLLKSESLTVDYIYLNINSSSNLSQLTSYFQALGFNCYQKTREKNKSRKELNNQNEYELTFITNIPYYRA